MTLRIDLSPKAEAKLRERAASISQPVEQVAAKLLEEAVQLQTLDELLAPVRTEFAATGMTDDQLAALLEHAKHDLRSKRRAGPDR